MTTKTRAEEFREAIPGDVLAMLDGYAIEHTDPEDGTNWLRAVLEGAVDIAVDRAPWDMVGWVRRISDYIKLALPDACYGSQEKVGRWLDLSRATETAPVEWIDAADQMPPYQRLVLCCVVWGADRDKNLPAVEVFVGARVCTNERGEVWEGVSGDYSTFASSRIQTTNVVAWAEYPAPPFVAIVGAVLG